MPEGPEIRRAADNIATVLEGQTVHKVRFGLPRLKRFARTLAGHKVVAVETRGKALLTHFDHGHSVYSHNQLYGVWRIVAGHRLPQSRRSLRMLLQTDSHSAILYSASDISVWQTDRLEEHPFLSRIGPDIMDPRLTWRDVAARLADPAFSKRQLSALYLDQAFLAGNGNYLRSEILYVAGLRPDARPVELSRGERGRLARATLAISRRSYETGGITTAPALARRLEKQGLSRAKRRFYVFGRAGRPCHSCGGRVLRSTAQSRRLYVCAHCQDAPAGA
ncbi:MAG: endonuclease VIII [Halioglobus sp.]|nr:endonuclease VIII [Halioglobus sp.]